MLRLEVLHLEQVRVHCRVCRFTTLVDAEKRGEDSSLSVQVMARDAEYLSFPDHLHRFDSLNH